MIEQIHTMGRNLHIYILMLLLPSNITIIKNFPSYNFQNTDLPWDRQLSSLIGHFWRKNRLLTTLGLKRSQIFYFHQTLKKFWIKTLDCSTKILINILPESFSNSLAISSLDLDFGTFPTKRRVLGTETLTFNVLPSAISREFSWKFLTL